MLKEKEAIIKMMRKKAELLEVPYYFTEKDERSIKSWKNQDAKRVFEEITYELEYEAVEDACICPFCIYNPSCIMCAYGKHHGICADCDSAYQISRKGLPGHLQRLMIEGKVKGRREYAKILLKELS